MYNKVIIIGRLTVTPEQQTSNEKSVTRNDCCQSPLQGS